MNERKMVLCDRVPTNAQRAEVVVPAIGRVAELREIEMTRVCNEMPTAISRYRLPTIGLKRFHDDCAEIGIRSRRNHDCRRTTVSLLAEDQARDTIVSYIIWGPGKKVKDIYTTLPWRVFCEEMLKLQIVPIDASREMVRECTNDDKT